jgi:hypothetical protein
MNRLIKLMLIAAAAMLTAVSVYAEPDQTTQAIFKNLMAATVSNNYDGFIAESDATMKAALTKRMLQRVSKELEPRAMQGYDARYLGELNQRGLKVHLWRLIFKDGGDDVLATLRVKDGKADNFLLQ